MRPAIVAWTVSGSAPIALSAVSSRSAHETSSAKNGFPPDASATSGASDFDSLGSSRSASAVAAASVERAQLDLADVAAPPGRSPGRRSISSGRLVQSRRRGASPSPNTASSSRSRRPSSAQWASSMPITSGRSAASSPTKPPPGAPQPLLRTGLALGLGTAQGAGERGGDLRGVLGAEPGEQRSPARARPRRPAPPPASGRVPEDLAERPEGDSAAVGRVSPDQHRGRVGLIGQRRRSARWRAGSCRSRPRR